MCGPSGQQTQIAGQQQGFYSQLQSAYATNFGEQQGILSSLTNALSPILQGGPNQQGFSAAENAALTGGAINSAANQFRNASTVAQAAGGGNTGVTTGAQQALQGQIATGVGNNLSSNLNQINLENYAQGRQNFFGAEQALAGTAQIENPLGYAGATTNAGGQAFNEATQIQNMRNQEQADIAGGIASVALAPFTGGMSLAGLSGLGGGGSFPGESTATNADSVG
jgi:hypothetical protein